MTIHSFTNTRFLWVATVAFAMLVYVVGMFVTIMEIDAAVYAEISREMAESGDFLTITSRNVDWLDKPHFQFWITAISFKLFGISSFSYKLPAVLFMLLGAYYTFLFGKKFYSSKHGYLAVLILMTAQHIITSNSDVRAEPYLTGLTIMAMYYLAAYLSDKKIGQIILGSLVLACLLMAKGLFTIIPVAAGIGLALLYEKRWKAIFHWQWLVVAGLTLLFTMPTLYGYYSQFDMHPEKEVFGQTGVSGIRFFFWDSQWGRFTNSGPIKGAGDPAFFLHTLLWAFMPWAFLAYFALYHKTRLLIRRKARFENFTYFGFVFMFIVFSISKFQLPHYLNAIFPFLAIISAHWLFRFAKNTRFLAVFYPIQLGSSVLLIVAIIVLHFFFSQMSPTPDVYLVFFAGLGIITLLLTLHGQIFRKTIFVSAITILMVNYYINRSFYPELLTYQAESEVAFYMQKYKLNQEKLILVGVKERMISFVQNRVVPVYSLDEATPENMPGKYIFTDEAGKKHLESMPLIVSEIKSFQDFPVTTLNGKFLNKNTRLEAVKMRYLLKTSTKLR